MLRSLIASAEGTKFALHTPPSYTPADRGTNQRACLNGKKTRLQKERFCCLH